MRLRWAANAADGAHERSGRCVEQTSSIGAAPAPSASIGDTACQSAGSLPNTRSSSSASFVRSAGASSCGRTPRAGCVRASACRAEAAEPAESAEPG